MRGEGWLVILSYTHQKMFVHGDGGGVAVTALRPDNVSMSPTQGLLNRDWASLATVRPFYTRVVMVRVGTVRSQQWAGSSPHWNSHQG